MAKVLIAHKWNEIAENDTQTIKNIESKCKEILKYLDHLNFSISEFNGLLQEKGDKELNKNYAKVLNRARDVQEIDKV